MPFGKHLGTQRMTDGAMSSLTDARPMRFSGHETFACRYAWLPKAYRALKRDPAAFSDEDGAMVELGLGKNMVRSLRFWVDAAGLAQPAKGRELELTEFAHAVFQDNGFDRSEEHTSELQSLMRISYAVFCLKKKK